MKVLIKSKIIIMGILVNKIMKKMIINNKIFPMKRCNNKVKLKCFSKNIGQFGLLKLDIL